MESQTGAVPKEQEKTDSEKVGEGSKQLETAACCPLGRVSRW
jgi:hypothetical protein